MGRQRSSVFKTLLDIGCTLDWITPAVAFVKDICNGPCYTFSIPERARTGRSIKRLLRQHGISHWGCLIVNNSFIFTVRQGQAHLVQHLLQQQGVPIENPLKIGRKP